MRRNNLKDILKDLEQPMPEQTIRVTRDENLEKNLGAVLKVYERELERKWTGYFTESPDPFYKFCRRSLLREKYKITPQLISEFALQVYNYVGEYNFTNATGVFLTALVQQSFLQGHNDFEVQLIGSTPINYFGRDLHGWRERRLKILVANHGVSPEPGQTIGKVMHQLAIPVTNASINNMIIGQTTGWFAYAQNVDARLTGMTEQMQGLATSAKSCKFGVDIKELADTLNEMFVKDQELRVLNNMLWLDDKSEAYLLEVVKPNVLEVDGDKLLDAIKEVDRLLDTIKEAESNKNLGLVRMVA